MFMSNFVVRCLHSLIARKKSALPGMKVSRDYLHKFLDPIFADMHGSRMESLANAVIGVS